MQGSSGPHRGRGTPEHPTLPRMIPAAARPRAATACAGLGQKHGWFKCSHRSAFRKEGAPEAAQRQTDAPPHILFCIVHHHLTPPHECKTIAPRPRVRPSRGATAMPPTQRRAQECFARSLRSGLRASPRAAASRGASLPSTSRKATLGRPPTPRGCPPAGCPSHPAAVGP